MTNTIKNFIATEEEKVVQLFDEVGHEIVNDSTALYNRARAAALATNTEVTKLKELLQTALVKSSDAHSQAVLLGTRLLTEAKAEIVKVEQQVAAHEADLAAQAAQVLNK